ncbi:sulfurtransferase TusA family protein [Azospirillum halopraeferens]|uniref:sulfurtransferase TusA family protein n=1 Tax=Azospirillum halopraeferens TaxID=34010 RepID=UPI00040F290C|nr:sulfurtransferase TusA family protein [Azospirillum halopraeferens]
MSTDVTEKQTLDVKGLNCPQPLVKAKKALQGVPVGSLLEVHATDPGARDDFASFCRSTGHELVEQKEEGGAFIFLIRRKK